MLKTIWRGLPLLLIPIGIYSQQFYVALTKGTGVGYVEIPFASSGKLVDQLQNLELTRTPPVVVSDSANPSLFKIAATYFRGHRFHIASRDFFPTTAPTRNVYVNRNFDLRHVSLMPRFNSFEEDHTMEESIAKDGEVLLLASTGTQTILNRSSDSGSSGRVIKSLSWKDARNFLIFVHSDLGRSMMTPNRRLTSYYPLFFEDLTQSSLAPVGRYLLFRVANPDSQFRLLLNLSARDRELPPASIVGETREKFDFIGLGSARAVSPPLKAQLIEGVPYVCLDMGAEPRPSPELRTGLMKMWNRRLPLDFKQFVALARNISIVTEDEYQSFRAPDSIQKIPADFLNQQFEFSGAYEDGWLSENSYLILNSNDALQPLSIRATVPLAGNAAFATNLSVLVDGEEVGREKLTVGDFEFRFPVAHRPGRRRVDLRFDNSQPLLGGDLRRAAALLRCVSFSTQACEAKASADILTDGKSIWRGNNWYPLEKQKDSNFRWVNNDAEILASPGSGGADLAVQLEPGPSLGGKPLQLEARDASGNVLLRKDISRRETVHLALASPARNALSTVQLHSLNGGTAIANEPRVLNFRVFHAALQVAAVKPGSSNDIAATDDVIHLGANWYPIEAQGNDHFRWVNNDAVLSISDPRVLPKGITMEIEPGPGVKKRPMLLRVFDSAGNQVQALEIPGRQTINIFPPATAKKPAEYRLHVEGGGQKIASDPRILNFRVLKLYTGAHGAASNVSSGGDIAEGTGIQIGKGWFPVESFTDGTFRWVDNDAQFTVDAAHTRVTIELQPGPGLDFKPTTIKILDASGRQVQAAQVNGRQSIRLVLPSAKGLATYRLHVDGGGKKIASDPRILNFRVFKIKPSD